MNGGVGIKGGVGVNGGVGTNCVPAQGIPGVAPTTPQPITPTGQGTQQ
jgi:hypothetical protein